MDNCKKCWCVPCNCGFVKIVKDNTLDDVKKGLFDYYKENPDALDNVIKLVQKDREYYDSMYSNCTKHIRLLEDFKADIEKEKGDI